MNYSSPLSGSSSNLPAIPVISPDSTLANALIGNKCGHFPDKPLFFTPPSTDKHRPKFIEDAIKKIRKYYNQPSFIPTLDRANGKSRQTRSERREATIRLLSGLLYHTDLKTLRVGLPQHKTFSGITLEKLCQITGLTRRRAERAHADLVAAGIVRVHPIAERREDGSYRGLAAIRTISKHFFRVIGITKKRLKEEGQKSEQRQFVKQTDTRQRDKANKLLAGAADVTARIKMIRQIAKLATKTDPPDP